MIGSVRLILLLALIVVGCRSRIKPERESDIYGGTGVVALPSIGGQVTGGQYFWKSSDKYDFAFELRANVEGGASSATQSGGFYQVQMGVKQILSPGYDQHLFFRYGLTWFRAIGDPNLIREPGDYLGGFGSVGYEWRLGKRWWIGPEAIFNLVNGEAGLGTEFVPQVGLNLVFDF